jgi:hypothetical protein
MLLKRILLLGKTFMRLTTPSYLGTLLSKLKRTKKNNNFWVFVDAYDDYSKVKSCFYSLTEVLGWW